MRRCVLCCAVKTPETVALLKQTAGLCVPLGRPNCRTLEYVHLATGPPVSFRARPRDASPVLPCTSFPVCSVRLGKRIMRGAALQPPCSCCTLWAEGCACSQLKGSRDWYAMCAWRWIRGVLQKTEVKTNRGVLNRNTALEFIEARKLRGLIYFMDDDNTYAPQVYPRIGHLVSCCAPSSEPRCCPCAPPTGPPSLGSQCEPPPGAPTPLLPPACIGCEQRSPPLLPCCTAAQLDLT